MDLIGRVVRIGAFLDHHHLTATRGTSSRHSLAFLPRAYRWSFDGLNIDVVTGRRASGGGRDRRDQPERDLTAATA
jgi:hypothetical protein